MFEATVFHDGKALAVGRGKTKRRAEQEAALRALRDLEQQEKGNS